MGCVCHAGHFQREERTLKPYSFSKLAFIEDMVFAVLVQAQ